MFERNSIRAGLSISMVNKDKEEAIHAITKTIEEVGEPLRKYISSKDNFNEFLNVSYPVTKLMPTKFYLMSQSTQNA